MGGGDGIGFAGFSSNFKGGHAFMLEENPAARESTRREHVINPAPVVRNEHAESSFTCVLEQQAAKIPSHWFLAGAMASMAGSGMMEMLGRQRAGRFLGVLAPSLLVMGVYNKLVKLFSPR